MAATLVGQAFLTSTLDVLFDRLASKEFINFFRGRKHDASLLKKLKLKLVGLNKVLNDAEDKQITDRAVKEWLDELKGAVYDAEDLVDEIATQALRCKVEAEYQSGSNQGRPLLLAPPWLYPCTKLFDDKIESKLEKMIDTLEDFSKEIDVLGLREVAGRNWSQIRLPTTSLEDESCLYGRENDKEEIMKLLLSDGESSNKVDVIPIVGMGGVGKTTLAQRLYNDDKLYGHFVKKAWVCVSDKFDVERVTRTIVEEVNGQASDARSLNSLQVKLKESLSGKKFLIVLDDVWNENYDNWIALMTPFKFGAQGSKIIVTTRNESVATIMQTVPIHGLKKLPEEDCWKLFSKHAFEKGDGNAYPNLERIGKEIVRKCNGLPLAVKMLGGILRSQRDLKDWNNILESAIWELSEEKSNIPPALRLSYHYLPSYLKRCFAYCSIFLKEYEFNMEELVSIWMAEGLLVKPKNYKTVEEEGYELVSIWMAEGLLVKPKNYKTVEEEGYECFRELLSRSFFQRSNANDSLYVMHDLVHDLAQYVMGDFCYRIEDGNPHGIAEKVRYLSIVSSRPVTSKKFMEIKEAKCLRTFLPLKHKDYCGGTSYLNPKDMDEILPRLTHLRLLSLRDYMIKELPHSIGDMIYLRFLDLSYNLIRELPKSVYTLYNLETLLLVDCGLETLSADLVKLISLRHLDLRGSNLKEMPMNISRLKDLQRLTIFIVGKCSGSGINELGEFHCLRGTISISGLQNVKSGHDAMEAKMSEKKHLERLALEWDSTTEDSLNAREVLEKLEPHTNLKHLEIKNYGGTRFPTWLEDQSFCNMVSLRLEDCENCFILPSLGQMPSLKELSIARMPGITNVGCEFYGETSSLSNPFPSLETLCFKEMSGWVGWCILDAGEFSRLKKLEVIMCPKLIGHLPTKVPSLVELNILCCPKLVASLPSTTSIRKLQLLNCQGMQLQWQGVSSVEILQILGFASLEEFPSELVTLTNLKDLVVHDCPRLYVPQSTEMSHCTMFLDLLILSECESLKSIPLGLFPKLRELGIWNCTNFETLILEGCKNTLSFPGGGLPAPNLCMLFIQGSKKLKSLPEQMHTLLPSLDKLELDGCPEIESFPEGGLPSALTDLSISNCEKLKSFPEGGLPSKLVNLTIHNCKKLFGGRRDWGLQTLPSLKWLSVGGESEDVLESFPEEGLLPSTLTFLCIRDLLNLKSLNGRGLQLLGSLDCMKIVNCPQLQSLPEEGLPTSLFTLKFEDCPLLKPRCRRDWPVIAHIGAIFMDNQPFMDGWMD